MGRLEGRTAVITGAAQRHRPRRLPAVRRAKARSVVCVDRADAVGETAKMIAKAGGKAVAMTGDAGDEAFVKGYIDARSGRVRRRWTWSGPTPASPAAGSRCTSRRRSTGPRSCGST